MSTSTTNSLALHEIILSIADSLNDAQQQLRSMPPYDEYGRPNTLYQLPYLDFNLEVISQFESTQTGGSEMTEGMHGIGVSVPQVSIAPAIRFAPFRSTETTTKNQSIITSTISGRFVAVMPNEGLPQIFLSCTSELTGTDTDYADYKLTIKVLRANNDPVAGQRVEVNFDESTSLGFNDGEEISTPIFSSAKDGYTNTDGEFSVPVRIDIADYDAEKTIVFKANSGTQFSSIAISKP